MSDSAVHRDGALAMPRLLPVAHGVTTDVRREHVLAPDLNRGGRGTRWFSLLSDG